MKRNVQIQNQRYLYFSYLNILLKKIHKPNILLAVLAGREDGALTAVLTDRMQQHRQRLEAASFLSFGITKRHVHMYILPCDTAAEA